MSLKLAINGGEKAVKIPFPHWKWPLVDDRDIDVVIDQMKNGKMGKNGMFEIVDQLESNFKEFHGMKHALALNSETSCLHAAFYSLGITEGDEVIVPSFTFPSTGLPLLSLGGIPILCDCQRDTSNIDPSDIEKKITSKTKAIVITHNWGHPCEMDEIMSIAQKHNLPVVEDCAHCPGAKYKGQYVGTFGSISCFSFDNNKLLASGEAGILMTNSQNIFEKSVVFSDFGGRLVRQVELAKYAQFKQSGLAVKYRIHPLAAAIANEKFGRLEEFNSIRRSNLNYFTKRLKESKCITPPPVRDYVEIGGFYGYKPTYMSLNEISIDRYIELLWAEGVDIRKTMTPPLHRIELFNDSKNYGVPLNKKYEGISIRYTDEDFPNASWFQDNHVSFATFSKDSDIELIDQYMDAIKKVETAIENGEVE